MITANNLFRIQAKTEELLIKYGFSYNYTINSYDHYWLNKEKNFEVLFNYNEEVFYLYEIAEIKSKFDVKLAENEITLEEIENCLKQI